MIFGYCRVSTPSQKIDRQIVNIRKAAPDAEIYSESFTGRVLNRPRWNALKKRVKAGDTIIFDSVSRMARSADEGIAEYMRLYDMGVELRFLNEPAIDTRNYRDALKNAVPLTGSTVDLILEGINSYLRELAKTQVRLAFEQAQKEVDDLSTRTKQGMATAKEAGHFSGRRKGTTVETEKAKESKAIILKHAKQFGGSLSDGEVIMLCQVSRNTYYKYKKELVETAGSDN